MIVVKLGGSLYHNDKLTLWLEHIAKIAKEENVIIVPGGGPFADQVRQSQLRHHFNDEHAHHMALLAMQQFGLLLLGLSKQAKPFYFPAQVLEYSSLSVWLPNENMLAISTVEQSWDITSDSLSLWLAQQVNADKLSLIKSGTVNSFNINTLQQQTLLDKGFAGHFKQAPVPTEIVSADKPGDLTTTLPSANSLHL